MAFERSLDHTALDAPAAAVDDAHVGEAGVHRGIDVVVDDRDDVGGREGVEIELGFDRNANRLVRQGCTPL